MKFRKKPVIVDAFQWFKNGDHPEVCQFSTSGAMCGTCNKPSMDHGWIDTLEGGHIVCPGDWIITGVKGEHYPCKPDIFLATYDEVEPEPAK